MQDITDRIFKGAITVFIKKGLQATTQEVAKEAGVAEVTLYRRYSTKENLFVTAIKNVVEKKLNSYINKIASEFDTEVFLAKLLENRLTMVSKHSDLIKMLLSESLRGNLTKDFDMPEIIFQSLKEGLEIHFKNKEKSIDADFYAQEIGGVLLSYVIFNKEELRDLSKSDIKSLAEKHANLLAKMID